MKVNITNAVKLFFPNPSLEMLYFEAVANAIDANADIIEIKIDIDSYSKPGTLKIEIKDNGDGFNDKNFEKFTKLLEIEEQDHKGVGRLVFLNYFREVDISSAYEHKHRKFLFTESFDEEEYELLDIDEDQHKTTLIFKGYRRERIKSYNYLKPESIRKSLLLHFFPLFYSLKVQERELKINISLNTLESNPDHQFFSDHKEVLISEIPNLDKVTFNADGLDLFEKLTLYYTVKENVENQSLITAICVDNRTIPVDILDKDAVPAGYEIIFLLYSNLFTGRVNSSRQELAMEKSEEKTLKKLFGDQVARILKEQIPKIQDRNREVTECLKERFPHLTGYFEEDSVGLIDRNQSLETAQKKFFNAQKDILNSTSLSDDQFIKSLEISSRLLTEYILYRNIIINKLKSIDKDSSEADIHNIIVPQRNIFKKDNLMRNIYNNNAWLFDDKYMSYTTILSEQNMDRLIKEILLEGESVEKDDTRPDIALIFSADPNNKTNSKLDVVIVELKKLGLGLAKKEELISQLRQRARKLLNYYPSRIQRIWFYGVVDFDKDFIRSLKEDDYLEVFSNDSYYYKELKIMPDYDENVKIPTGVNVLSFEALLKDAEARNSTFLKLLKEGFKKRAS